MLHPFSRTELVVGPEGLEKLKHSKVCVIGVGGVGSFAVEALARSGVGSLILIDRDDVDITNINRQLPALIHTVGQSKVQLMKERVLQINPDCQVEALQIFFNNETQDRIFAYEPDYIVDAIDTISSKIHLLIECKRRNIPVVSSMGAANKIDPSRFEVLDIGKTSVDPIAKVIRRELRKAGISKGIKVVCSTELPRAPREDVRQSIVPKEVEENSPIRKAKNPPASIAFVPPVAGMILASVAVRDLVGL
ncbi:tRNA threonylcarbamoyladenosine dehydratase [Fodinisporobacter ferrooxydans]|uniref:tRNA threonylcarbamoyladenosine dehydratase n=1 Tax=Fodinisporobacter ferrooxydans TaxID=2901836 RepID=A0ABY4CRK6_9BACL|nr:tRNA threonylcarbamoyladenosine dehydratase [Alicyclobacillaceae bacterium MYW30-H2]